MGIHHWQEAAIGFVAGITVIGTLWAIFSRPSGTLRIDRTNPDRDIFRFDVDEIDEIYKKKRIVLLVDPNANLSQDRHNAT